VSKIPENRQILVVVGLVVHEGKILMVRRSEQENSLAHMKWEYPGGKVDFGESPEAAVIREIEEETGVKARIKRLLPESFVHVWDYSWGKQHTIIYGYECEFVSKTTRIADHHVYDTDWVSIDEVLDRDNLPGAEVFLKFLGS